MKDIVSKLIFIVSDILIIVFSVYIAFLIRETLNYTQVNTIPYIEYANFYPLYIIVLTLFTYEGIYTYRYDFWHESRLVIKVLVLSAILVFAYLAMTKSIEAYSRLVIGLSFPIVAILIPLSKNIVKKYLFRLHIWEKKATIYGNDRFLTEEIYYNPYLGYVKPIEGQEPETIFINSKDHSPESLNKIITMEIKGKHEVIFIPLMNDYNLTHSQIYELFNTRNNLIVFSNKLKNRYLILLKVISDFLLSLVILPFLFPIILLIAIKIRYEDPQGDIFFTQKRLGKNGKIFICYKFRTMDENSDIVLQNYLKEHPEEISYYNQYHKYKYDPRITKFGKFLRKTSLDELPQILNVMKNEMSFIGPRPYMLNEQDKLGENCETILSVKPGITGLWQVSGRNDVDFQARIDLDSWYIRNWNLWTDVVILVKTIKTVLLQNGAQ